MYRPAGEPDVAARFNVLIYVMDTVRADHLGLYGYPRDTSPFLEELVDDGARWWTCTAASTWTWPSVCSLLTSVALPSHRCYSRYAALDGGWTTLADVLSDAGYSTALVTSNEVLRPRGKGVSSRFHETHFTRRPDSELTAVVADIAADPSRRPFFVYAQPLAAHQPYRNAAPFDSLFVGDPHYGVLGELPELNWSGSDCEGGMIATNVLGGRTSMDWYVSQYDGLIADSDEQLRRVFGALAAEGILDSTVVVITSDHGEELSGEHDYYFCHRDHYAGNIDVPLVIHVPAALASSGDSGYSGRATHLDVLPSILDVLGMAPLDQAQGRALLSQGPPSAWFEHDPIGGAWVEGDFKIIQAGPFPDPEAPIELYDLAVDPSETHDLFEEDPQTALRMGAALDSVTMDLLDRVPPIDVRGTLYRSDLSVPGEVADHFGPDLHMTGVPTWVERKDSLGIHHLSAATDIQEIQARMTLEHLGPPLADYHARARIRLRSGRMDFNTSTIEGGSGYTATVAAAGVSLRKTELDGTTIPWGSSPWEFDPGTWYDVAVTNDGATVCVEVDGVPLVCGSDPTPGSVYGNTSWIAFPDSRVEIREVEIWR